METLALRIDLIGHALINSLQKHLEQVVANYQLETTLPSRFLPSPTPHYRHHE